MFRMIATQFFEALNSCFESKWIIRFKPIEFPYKENVSIQSNDHNFVRILQESRRNFRKSNSCSEGHRITFKYDVSCLYPITNHSKRSKYED